MAGCVHVIVEQRFTHETQTTDQALVGLFIAVHKTMGISIVATVERFTAHLNQTNKSTYEIKKMGKIQEAINAPIGRESSLLTSHSYGFSPV